MNKITISTGHPDAGRVYAEAYDAASAREEALREEVLVLKKGGKLLVGDRDALQQRLTAANRELEAALAHEDSMREELARYKSLFGQAQKAIDRLNELHPKRMGELAKRLSVAEQRISLLEKPCFEDWEIDTTAGHPILVYKKCSVIEDEQAYQIVRMIEAAKSAE